MLVPGHDWLFSDADTALGHRQRFTEQSLRRLLEEAGYEVVEVRQFNRLGVLGWYVNKMLGRTDIGPWQARVFGVLLPLAKLVESLTFLPGLSLVAIGRRP